jgi:hypothetical protein
MSRLCKTDIQKYSIPYRPNGEVLNFYENHNFQTGSVTAEPVLIRWLRSWIRLFTIMRIRIRIFLLIIAIRICDLLVHRISTALFWASTPQLWAYTRPSVAPFLSLFSSWISPLMWIRIQLFTLMRIRIQLPKQMRIRIRNPVFHSATQRA